MSKRMFQILDEMNVADEVNKTQNVAVGSDLVSAQTVKAGGHVTIGVSGELIHRALKDEVKFILLAINLNEYERIKQQP